MYLMYVDESGDSGLLNSPTRYYVLTGLVLHELRWKASLDRLISFRRVMRNKFGLHLREEFHASAFINHPGELVRIKRHDRLAMIREFADFLSQLQDLNVINVVIDKKEKPPDYEVFEMAWKTLIQRFENTITRRNFPGPKKATETGLIVCDHTEDKKLTHLVRRLRRFNPVPHQTETFGDGYRNLPLTSLVEDPNFRDSRDSYFVQAADTAAFLLYQHLTPSSYIRKKAGHNYFFRLSPILCRHASSTDPYGIVFL